MAYQPKLPFAFLLCLLLTCGLADVAAAAETTVECGLFRDYLAPDPIGMVDGSISFGYSGPAEPIAADATLVPPTDTNLSSLGGGTPTCLTVVRDAGVITSLEFAPSGIITGPVVLVPDLFGPGADGYLIADRLFAPVDLLAVNDGLAAVIATAADSGSPLSITFAIDVATGVPTGFRAALTLTGVVTVQPDGDILVGAARLPDSVIADDARALLQEAADLGVVATVQVTGVGTLDPSAPGGVAMAITLDVTFDRPAPTPEPTASSLPNTAAVAHAPAGSAGGAPILAGGLAMLLGLAGVAWLMSALRTSPKRR